MGNVPYGTVLKVEKYDTQSNDGYIHIHFVFLLNSKTVIKEFELLHKHQHDIDLDLKVWSMPGKIGGYLFQNLLTKFDQILHCRDDS